MEKQQQMLREEAEREEMGDFELRKKPLDSSEDGNSNPGSSTQIPVPRSIILAQNLSPFQPNPNSLTPKAQLYDEANNSKNGMIVENSNSNLDAPSKVDTSSNHEVPLDSVSAAPTDEAIDLNNTSENSHNTSQPSEDVRTAKSPNDDIESQI